MKKSALTHIVLFFLTSSAFAQSSTGYDFLRSFVGARPAAMSGAYIAVQGDVHDISYNPAGLALVEKRLGTATYLNHLLDFQSGYLGYAHPLRKNSAIGVSLNYFDYGTFEGKDLTNLPTGDFGANSLVLSLAYGRQAINNLSIGGAGKYIRFQIEDYAASAMALDLSANYALPDVMATIGLGIFNIGNTTSAFIETKEDLPMNLQLGFTKQLQHLPFFLSGALVKFQDEGIDLRLGGEFTLSPQLFLRLGYNTAGRDQKIDSGKDRLAGISAGLGFQMNRFDIDYSFSSFGEVGSLNRITLVGEF